VKATEIAYCFFFSKVDPTRSTNRGNIVKIVKSLWCEVANVLSIKGVLFGLLQAEDGTSIFLYFISYRIPLSLTIYTANVPTKNILASIHDKGIARRKTNHVHNKHESRGKISLEGPGPQKEQKKKASRETKHKSMHNQASTQH
jgi:hypothetical protein